MNTVLRAIWIEWLKARRSRMPLFTSIAFWIAPLAGGYFMVVIQHPDLARRLGLISAKAQIAAASADWPTYLALLAQATAVGGSILFSLLATWVFGREYADRTVVDLLALPTPRFAIVLGKFVVVFLWSLASTAAMYLVGLGIGWAVGLPAAPVGIWWQGTITLVGTACLTIPLTTPIAFFASAGRGYLVPVGVTILALVLAQLVTVAGWGQYFPWSIPALHAGMPGVQDASLGATSYALVALTGLMGIAGTLAWWELADQTP